MTDNVNEIIHNTISEQNSLPAILLIEDDVINANVIQRFLKKDYKVDVAFNGVKGIELAQTNTYCLVLLDINLGRGITGLEVLTQLKQIEKFANIPIIASTAYTMKGDREKLLEAGFDDYISKPYTMDEILLKIKSVLAG